MKLRCFAEFIPNIFHSSRESKVLASLFSTQTTQPLSSSSSSASASLFDRIQIIRDPKLSVIPVLEKWINEGRAVEKRELQSLVKLMKDFRRFNHALEISQWMTDRRYFSLSPIDTAIRLDLVNRVHGPEKAENYFKNISDKLKTPYAYVALLNGYVREKSVEKAEAIMQKLREMGMTTSSFPYNLMINLYSQTGQQDKIAELLHEMENQGIPQDNYTMRNLCAAYVAESDITQMEKTLNLIEKDPHFDADWKVYSVAANGYLKVGLISVALVMLKKMEAKMPLYRRKSAFQFLLSLYARTGHKDELYRVWNTYKPSSGLMDGPYAFMITSLAKLDDIEGAERIFHEWESQCTMYDFRVLNRLLVAYCKRGLFDKAESIVNKAVKGRTPYASTWNVLAIGYFEHKQMDKAVEMLKKAMSVARRGWMPNSTALKACLDYLEENRDIGRMEEMVQLRKTSGPLTKDMYHRLLRTCVAAGRPVHDVLDQMKVDGFSADEETDKIIGTKPSL